MKKLKIILAGLCCCALGQSLPAQTFDEWFRQGKTRKKYLIKQVAALEDLLLTTEEGWRIAEEGIHDIGAIKNGEFDMHQSYFESLKNVNPVIKSDVYIRNIHQKIGILYMLLTQALLKWQKSPFLDMEELHTKSLLCLEMGELGEELADDLEKISTDGIYQLSDGERLIGIQLLEDQFLKLSGLARTFIDDTDLFISQRQQVAAN
ncbi:hypothetical protein ACX0G9_27015 [Flavitalea flava]